MRVAIIDLGTNSVRFDVYKISHDQSSELLHREKLMIRLGQGVFISQKLDSHAARRTLQALVNFRRLMNEYSVDQTFAFATSALRTAKDADFFLKRIKKRTGIDVEVISGKEEARLIAKGILAHEKNITGHTVLVDIGGGSTEINLCHHNKIIFSHSFDLGVARLQEVFLKSTPPLRHPDPQQDPIESLKEHCKKILEAELKPFLKVKYKEIVGSSGTIKALQNILAPRFNHKNIHELSLKMIPMTPHELLCLPRIEAKRTDLILAGTLLFEVIVGLLKPKKIRYTEFALREGIILDKLSSLTVPKSPSPEKERSLKPFLEKAQKLGADRPHFLKVLEFSNKFFDFFLQKKLLNKEDQFALQSASILHDVGYAISPSKHETHSAYIIQNSQLPFLHEEEKNFVSLLCKNHKSTKNTLKNLSENIDKKKQKDFLKILSILRLADAMDYGHKSAFSIRELKITPEKTFEITLLHTGSSYLEEMKIEQKKSLFEEVFNLKIELKIMDS